jgi:hypothetical protein
MKTISDLNAIIPTISEALVANNHEIGETNEFIYDEDGWYVEITYSTDGEYYNEDGDYSTPSCYELKRAWGEVIDLGASYSDEDGNEVEFSNRDLKTLRSALNEALKDI